ncbi:hypothetical protein TVAG_332210 [Trichomonas vaginalis G3]|uniref:Arrestin-like N-terminal domain-containing protein n=1 Tax=Trichomonas vaginalis (strain ATCC PRA-98 / G3) TaxID=412133 RepID=A2G8Y3_TRIV3|nr:vacuolar protein sorting-associated protein 26c family [Trichomonas vaginalis G3]EAX86385.1 hypothetical protein TVAG_332210 [Trichomonas vaginalis G3]KAI5508555.1 vacuolar protein sorting-associated protein 26c family [Trichomonas vaginalis G3]|eukprot:XP_001299315.1 hypothetical protein [Trichomonas vaginalis G3]
MTEITFEYDRFTRSYFTGEKIKGAVKVKTTEKIKPKEVTCTAYCIRTVDPNGHGLTSFDDPIPKVADRIVWQHNIPINPAPTVIEDGYTLPFEFTVPKESKMTESIRCKYISVDYFVEFVIKRGLLSSDIVGTKGFFIVADLDKNIPAGEPVEVNVNKVNPQRSMGKKANFKAHIHFNTNVATFTKPPTGWITIVDSDTPIEAITVSYIRNETILIDRTNPQTLNSEKSRTYIAENDPPHGIQIPFNIEWSRIHISADLETPLFSVSTSLKVRIVFTNGAYASTTIPLKLYHDLAY